MCDARPCLAQPIARASDVQATRRDRAGRIMTTVAGQVTENYRWSRGRVVGWSGDWHDGHEDTTLERDAADRIIASDERVDDGESRISYKYNAAGDLSEIVDGRAVTTLGYDERLRPVSITTVVTIGGAQVVTHRKLEWDARDRLVSDASLTSAGVAWRIETYRYDCR